MNEKIIEEIIKSLGSLKIDKNSDFQPKITKEREAQYTDLFGNKNEIINQLKKLPYYVIAQKTLNDYLEEIFASNPEIQEYQNKIEIIPIESKEHKTMALRFENNTTIVFDAFTMRFLWMMNKANYYGSLISIDACRNLYYQLFLHFGSLANIELLKSEIFPQPVTPAHQNIKSLNMLGLAIRIQEKFLVAHEVAHLIIDNKTDLCQNEDYSISPYLLIFEKEIENNKNIELELAADKIAFHLVANTLELSDRTMVEFFCNNIFLLIRYMLWSSLTFNLNDSNITNYQGWILRNAQLRTLITDFCKDNGGSYFIIETLEYLELTLETAALAARELLIKITNKT